MLKWRHLTPKHCGLGQASSPSASVVALAVIKDDFEQFPPDLVELLERAQARSLLDEMMNAWSGCPRRVETNG